MELPFRIKSIHAAFGIFCCALIFSMSSHAKTDSYPIEIAEKLLEKQRLEREASLKIKDETSNFLFNKNRWVPGSIVVVAFNGGNKNLHKAIADVASQWTRHANIKFDFGYDPATNSYRQWSTNDSSYKAHIRIGFSSSGYWSYIGRDSVSEYAPANAASMNFEGFDRNWPRDGLNN